MIETEVKDGVATVVMSRPEVLNALSFDDADELREALAGAATTDGVRAIVITGDGGAFSAGADLTAWDVDDVASYAADGLGRTVPALGAAMSNCPVPVIAAINGPCFGGAIGIALMADVAVAARSAYFVMPQVQRLGLVPDVGSSYLAARSVGRARVLAMATLGAKVTAEQAASWGLIWECVDDEALPGAATKVAARLAEDPEAVVATRALIDATAPHSLIDQLHHERDVVLELVARPQIVAQLAALTETCGEENGS